MAMDKKLIVLFIIMFVFKNEIVNMIYHSDLSSSLRKRSGWGRSSRFSSSAASENNGNIDNDRNVIQNEMLENFLKEWNTFYLNHVENEVNNHRFDNILYFFLGVLFLLVLIDTVAISLVTYKIFEKYVFIQRGTGRNGGGFFQSYFTLRRSFQLRMRAWKVKFVKHMALMSKRSKIVLAELHENEERKIYAYSIPLDLVPRVKVQWKEIGNDPSTMEVKLEISIESQPISVFNPSSSRLGSMIFGDAMNETDLFGPRIPLIEVPIDKNTADPGDVTSFWETEAIPLPEDQDDRLLYIRIPKHGHRVTDIQISNSIPTERID